LPNADFLFVTAEIAAAFVGFASVVAVLGQRATGDDPSLDAFRLRGMIQTGLLVVISALLPYLFHSAGFAGARLWRISSALVLVAGAAFLIDSIVSIRRVASDSRTHRWVGLFALALVAAPPLLLGLAALGIPSNPAPSYLVALYLYLLASALGLFRIVTSLLAGLSRPAA
jgi:hypothetical protein